MINPQIAYGEDVMSRISYSIEKGDIKLRKIILDKLNHMIQEMTGNPEKVKEVTIVANTSMHHIFLGLPVKQLGRAPYIPALCHSLDIKAKDLGLNIAHEAYIHFLPNIAGFVGADHVAMLLATKIYKTDKITIGIDIGTNTEIALMAKGIISTLSCASGPAFEGACIKHGMRVASGAIERIKISKDGIQLKIIDEIPPIGICGSGILDLISQ